MYGLIFNFDIQRFAICLNALRFSTNLVYFYLLSYCCNSFKQKKLIKIVYFQIPTCKELLLLGDENKESYSAAVHYNEGAGVVPVVAVSVTGQVIYWPNILTSTAAYFESKLQIAESLVDCKLTSTNVRIGVFTVCGNVLIMLVFSITASFYVRLPELCITLLQKM